MKGNAGGPGNPAAKQAAEFSRWFRDAVSESDIRAIARKPVGLAKDDGDGTAARVVLDRLCGQITPGTRTRADPRRKRNQDARGGRASVPGARDTTTKNPGTPRETAGDVQTGRSYQQHTRPFSIENRGGVSISNYSDPDGRPIALAVGACPPLSATADIGGARLTACFNRRQPQRVRLPLIILQIPAPPLWQGILP